MDKTLLVVSNLLLNGWEVKLDGEYLMAKRGRRKWLVKAIWGKPEAEKKR